VDKRKKQPDLETLNQISHIFGLELVYVKKKNLATLVE